MEGGWSPRCVLLTPPVAKQGAGTTGSRRKAGRVVLFPSSRNAWPIYWVLQKNIPGSGCPTLSGRRLYGPDPAGARGLQVTVGVAPNAGARRGLAMIGPIFGCLPRGGVVGVDACADRGPTTGGLPTPPLHMRIRIVGGGHNFLSFLETCTF